jgi:hypothetical protein
MVVVEVTPIVTSGIIELVAIIIKQANKQIPWPLVRKRTMPTERPPLVGEI